MKTDLCIFSKYHISLKRFFETNCQSKTLLKHSLKSKGKIIHGSISNPPKKQQIQRIGFVGPVSFLEKIEASLKKSLKIKSSIKSFSKKTSKNFDNCQTREIGCQATINNKTIITPINFYMVTKKGRFKSMTLTDNRNNKYKEVKLTNIKAKSHFINV